MKKLTYGAAFCGVISLSLFLLHSCVKDNYKHTYTVYVPVFEKLGDARAAVQSQAPQTLQNTGKIYIKDNWIFINERDKGIHIIDNSNPSHPLNAGFLNIPGNRDMAVKGNILYADLHCDLAVLDITDPLHAVVKKFLTNVDPSRLYNYTATTNVDSIQVVSAYVAKDTVVTTDMYKSWGGCTSCGVMFNSQVATATSATGTGGSMQRFTIVNNYLYTVSTNIVNVVDVSTAGNPVLAQKKYMASGLESIYPFQGKLFIGSATGMVVLDISNDPANPQQAVWVSHWCSGDPVIADDHYAYVTLHAASACRATINELEIYDTGNPSSLALVKTYPFAGPQGLAKDGNLLFICDGTDGVQVLDATDVRNLRLLHHITGMDAHDVILDNGRAFVIAKGKLLQYDYNGLDNIKLLSQLGTGN